ncbi:DUF1190 domain-containing protein [Erwinia sp. MYb535]|uniref:DUF1190 domain-containing protein n=1 Tax=Erwinia sp. MYb535 TaxID=2745309 RepID=UPI0030B471A7
MKKKRRRVRASGKRPGQFTSYSKGAALNTSPRKGPSWLTLAIMGGAGVALLYSFHDEKSEKDTLFANSNECVQAGYSVRACEAQEQAAQQQLDVSSQAFDHSYDCQNYYGIGNCHYNLARHQFLPLLAGFSMGKRPQEENQSSSSSGGGPYGGGRAFYRDRDDRSLLRTPDSEARWTSSANDAHSIKGRTVSRGGFGSGSHRSGGG